MIIKREIEKSPPKWPTILLAVVVVVSVVGIATAFLRKSPVDELIEQLQGSDATTRYKAAKQLEELGLNATAAVDELALALADGDVRVRYRSAKALSTMEELASAAVPALMVGLQDTDRDVRYYCAKSIYKIGEEAEAALDTVLAALKVEEDADIRRYLVKSLGDIGEGNEAALLAAKRLQNDTNPQVREAAKDALEELQP